MAWCKRLLACGAGTMGAVWLLTGATAIAQEGRAKAPAGKETLDRTFGVRSGGNDEAAEVQKRVDAISDETDDLLAQYRTVLKQTDSMGIYNRQMRELIASQEAELASLEDQLARVQGVGRSVDRIRVDRINRVLVNRRVQVARVIWRQRIGVRVHTDKRPV